MKHTNNTESQGCHDLPSQLLNTSVIQNPHPMDNTTVTGVASDESFALLSAPCQVDCQESCIMQSVLVCAPGRPFILVVVSAFTTWSTILLQHAGYALNVLHLVVLKIRNKCVSIAHMVADYVDATEGEIQLHIDLPEKGGVRGNLIGATKGRNVPSQQQRIDTEGNAPTLALDSEVLNFITSIPGYRPERNAPAAEETNDSIFWNYITSAPGYRTGRNPPAAEETTEDAEIPSSCPETRQQSDICPERIQALLGISPIVKTANQAKSKQPRKKIKGKSKKSKKASERGNNAAKTAEANQDKFEWDPMLIFKDKIHLLSTGCKTPIIEFCDWV